jgi:hypothetical protein
LADAFNGGLGLSVGNCNVLEVSRVKCCTELFEHRMLDLRSTMGPTTTNPVSKKLFARQDSCHHMRIRQGLFSRKGNMLVEVFQHFSQLSDLVHFDLVLQLSRDTPKELI